MAKQSALQKSTNALVVIILTVIGAILVNVIGNTSYGRLDLTEGQLNSLSDATVELIQSFDDEVELTVYISPNMPDKIPDPMAPQGGDEVKKLDLRLVTQKFRDVLEEYKSRSNGKIVVKYADGTNLVELAKKAKLKTFAGEEAKATGDSVEFTEYVLGATFSYAEVMERFPLALEPAYFEFEITKRLQRLKEKADASVPMKFVLRNGEKLNKAVQACQKSIEAAVPKEDTNKQDALSMLTGEGTKAKIASLKNAATDITRECKGVAEALKAARETKLSEPNKPFENLLTLANAFQESTDKMIEALAAEDQQQQLAAAQLLDRAILLGDSTEARHDILEDSPGKKAIGFVCAAGTFCPFPSNKPLVPPELKGALAGKNQFNARIIQDLEGLAETLNRQLAAIQQQLFESRGFRLVQVDLTEHIPSYVKGVVVLGAREKFTDAQLYYMDQFVLGGGSLVAFINSWDVAIQNWSANDRMDVTQLLPNESNIGDLLGHYGIRPNGDLVMEPESHDAITLRATVRQGQLAFQAPKKFPYPMLPMVTDFDTESPLVRSVSTMTLPYASSLVLSQSDGVRPLVRTSPQAVTTTDLKFPLLPDQQSARVKEQVNSEPKALVLAAVSNGEFSSYFDGKDRKIPELGPKNDKKADDPNAKDAKKDTSPDQAHRPQGIGRVLVVGSNMGLESLSQDQILKGFTPAMVADNALQHIDKIRQFGANFRNWQTRLGQIEHLIVDQRKRRFGESLQFIFNALDWSVQNEALVALRSKNLDRRPLKQISEDQQSTYRYLGIGLGPLLVALFGGLIWFMRRRGRQRVAYLAGSKKPFGL